MLEVIVQLA